MTTINTSSAAVVGTPQVVTATGATVGDAGTWNGQGADAFAPQSAAGVDAGDGTFSYTASWTPGQAGIDTISFSNGTDADNASLPVSVTAAVPSNPAWTTNPAVVSAAASMNAVSDFTSAAACGPVKAFQAAVTAAGGPALTVDGGYGAQTAAANAQVAAANGGGNVQAALTSGFPSCGGAVTPPATPPNNTTPTTAGSSGMPTWLKWVLGLIVVGGVGALGYWAFFTPSGKRMFAGESKKKRRQRKARASARKRRAKKK